MNSHELIHETITIGFSTVRAIFNCKSICYFSVSTDPTRGENMDQYRIAPATMLETRARRREMEPSSDGWTRFVRRMTAV